MITNNEYKPEKEAWTTFDRDLTERDKGTPWETSPIHRRDIEPEKVFPGSNTLAKVGQWTVEGLRKQEAGMASNDVSTMVRWFKNRYPETFLDTNLSDDELFTRIISDHNILIRAGHIRREGAQQWRNFTPGQRLYIIQNDLLYGDKEYNITPKIPGFKKEGMFTSIPVISDLIEGLVRTGTTTVLTPSEAAKQLKLSRQSQDALIADWNALSDEEKNSPAGLELLGRLRANQDQIEHQVAAYNALLVPEMTTGLAAAAVTAGTGRLIKGGLTALRTGSLLGRSVPAWMIGAATKPGVRNLVSFLGSTKPIPIAIKAAAVAGAEGGIQETARGMVQNKTPEEIKEMGFYGALYGTLGGAGLGFALGHGLPLLGRVGKKIFGGKKVSSALGLDEFAGVKGTPEQLAKQQDTFNERTPEEIVKGMKIDEGSPYVEQVTNFFKAQYGEGVVNAPFWPTLLKNITDKVEEYFKPENKAARKLAEEAARPLEFKDRQTGATLDLKKVLLVPDPKKPHQTSIQDLIRVHGKNPRAIRALVDEAKSRNGGVTPKELHAYLNEAGFDVDGNPKAPAAPAGAAQQPVAPGTVPSAGQSTVTVPPEFSGPQAAPSAAADGRYNGRTYNEWLDNGPESPTTPSPFFNPFIPVADRVGQSLVGAPDVPRGPLPEGTSRWSDSDDSGFGEGFKTFHAEFNAFAQDLVNDILNGGLHPSRAFAILNDYLSSVGFPRGKKVTVMMADGMPDSITDVEYAKQVFARALYNSTSQMAGQFDDIVARIITAAPNDVQAALAASPNSAVHAIDAYDAWSIKQGADDPAISATLDAADQLSSMNPERLRDTQEATKDSAFRTLSPVPREQRRNIIHSALSRLGSLFIDNNTGKVRPGEFLVGSSKKPVRISMAPDDDGVIIGRPNDKNAPEALDDLVRWSDEERVPLEARVTFPVGYQPTNTRFRAARLEWRALRTNLDADSIVLDVRNATPSTLKADGSLDAETFAGGTFHLDGRRWDEPDKLILGVLSENFDPDTFSVQDIISTLAKHREAIGDRDMVFGVFRFYDKVKKKDVVSVDINLVLDPSKAGAAVVTGARLGQRSLWLNKGGGNGSLIETGATGNKPGNPSAGLVSRIYTDLQEGRTTELTPKSALDQYLNAGFYWVNNDESNRLVLRRDPSVSSRVRGRVAKLIDDSINNPPPAPPTPPAPPAVPSPEVVATPSVEAPAPAPPLAAPEGAAPKPKKPRAPRPKKKDGKDKAPKAKKDEGPPKQILPLTDQTKKPAGKGGKKK